MWKSRSHNIIQKSRERGGGEKLGRGDCGVRRQEGGEQGIAIRQKLEEKKTSDHFTFLRPLSLWMSLRSHPWAVTGGQEERGNPWKKVGSGWLMRGRSQGTK